MRRCGGLPQTLRTLPLLPACRQLQATKYYKTDILIQMHGAALGERGAPGWKVHTESPPRPLEEEPMLRYALWPWPCLFASRSSPSRGYGPTRTPAVRPACCHAALQSAGSPWAPSASLPANSLLPACRPSLPPRSSAPLFITALPTRCSVPLCPSASLRFYCTTPAAPPLSAPAAPPAHPQATWCSCPRAPSSLTWCPSSTPTSTPGPSFWGGTTCRCR